LRLLSGVYFYFFGKRWKRINVNIKEKETWKNRLFQIEKYFFEE